MSYVPTDGRPPMDAAFQNFKTLNNISAKRVVSSEHTAATAVAGEVVVDVGAINDLTVGNLTVTGTISGLNITAPSVVVLPLINATVGSAELKSDAKESVYLHWTGYAADQVAASWSAEVSAGEKVLRVFISGTDGADKQLDVTVDGTAIDPLLIPATAGVVVSSPFTWTGGLLTVALQPSSAVSTDDIDLYGDVLVVDYVAP